MLDLILTGLLCIANPPADQKPTFEYSYDSSSPNLEVVNHSNFQKGERLEYDVSYGWITAGEAIISIKDENHAVGGRNVLHVVGEGNSLDAFNWFFKVRDRYETYLDEEGVFPWVFVRDIHEGGFELQQYYSFNHYQQSVSTDKGEEFEVPVGIQDMISAFYRARTLDLTGMKPGDTFELEAFVDEEVWPLQIRYDRREVKKIGLGKFDCMVFTPVVQEGRIFEEEEDLQVWITADQNRIPILAEAKVLVGSISMEIREYSGLANPISKLD